MPAAKTTEELEQQIMEEMRKAMNKVEKQAMKDMQRGTKYFYSGGSPLVYERTGTLGKTPQITNKQDGGNTISFDAILNQEHNYLSGDRPLGGQVLDLANYGTAWTTASGHPARPTVGAKGFWEKSEQWISESLDKIMGQHFPG